MKIQTYLLMNFQKCFSLPYVFCIVIGCTITMNIQAQLHGTKKATSIKKVGPKMVDSTWKKDLIITDTASADAINRIETINNTLKSFNNIIQKGYDTSDISESLPQYSRNLKLVKYNVSSIKGSQNLRNLSLMQDMLGDIIADLKDWQSSLLSYYTQIAGITAQMRAISVDSVSKGLPADAALRLLYQRRVAELKTKWLSTDTITRITISKIDRLQTAVSAQYEDALELQNAVNTITQNYNATIFDDQYGYILSPSATDSSNQSFGGVLHKSVKITGKVVNFYINDNWSGRILAIILSLLFFIWTYVNIRHNRKNNSSVFDQLKYLDFPPVIAALVFLFTLIPFMDINPPVVFVELVQLLLAVSLSMLLVKKWPLPLFIAWLFLFVMLLLHSINGLLVSFTYTSRIAMLFLDGFSVFLGWKLLNNLRENKSLFPKYINVVAYLFIILNILAVICNLTGRLPLSQIFGNTAISSLVQAISLTVFIQLFLDAICLQLESDKKSSRFTAYLNYQNVALRVRTILTFIASVFWLINLAQNLNVYQQSYDFLDNLFTRELKIGNNSFTLGSIFTFFVVIWLANFIQKYIGYFFGDTEDDLLPEKKSKLGTSVLLVRLIILTAGFFIGILASGIPLDKVTIVIGALGVGIGLGLQNIVNNLVSGVILAIERPIQVGDLIEIGTSSGHVKEIGIRASHIITADGAEIIIPNGDMLSQKLINWTLSNTHIREEIVVKLTKAADAENIKQLVMDILSNNEDIMTKPGPQIVVRNISQAGAEIQILFWAFDINKAVQLKSDVLQKIFERCSAADIAIV
jgi:small-conductance mechanosensitive channel